MPSASPPLPAALQPLASLFLKSGVAIGGLSEPQRQLVLALVWAGLPTGPMAERDVNDALKRRLAGAAAFLATDHVELRRWLVDAGWLVRDGYGREYRRVDAAALADGTRSLGTAFAGVDTDAVGAATRAAHAAERAARRRAWSERPGDAPR